MFSKNTWIWLELFFHQNMHVVIIPYPTRAVVPIQIRTVMSCRCYIFSYITQMNTTYQVLMNNVISQPTRHIGQYWINVGPPSATLAQHLPNVGLMYRDCCDMPLLHIPITRCFYYNSR